MTHEEFKARYKYDYSADLLGEGERTAWEPRRIASIQTLESNGTNQAYSIKSLIE